MSVLWNLVANRPMMLFFLFSATGLLGSCVLPILPTHYDSASSTFVLWTDLPEEARDEIVAHPDFGSVIGAVRRNISYGTIRDREVVRSEYAVLAKSKGEGYWYWRWRADRSPGRPDHLDHPRDLLPRVVPAKSTDFWLTGTAGVYPHPGYRNPQTPKALPKSLVIVREPYPQAWPPPEQRADLLFLVGEWPDLAMDLDALDWPER